MNEGLDPCKKSYTGPDSNAITSPSLILFYLGRCKSGKRLKARNTDKITRIISYRMTKVRNTGHGEAAMKSGSSL